MDYETFLMGKAQLGGDHGFEPEWMPGFAFDFQRSLIEWSLRKGRAAVFADCGLGKTIIELSFAENVVRHTGKNVLLLTPLAVAHQIRDEAERFGIETHAFKPGDSIKPGITVTNYEKLHHLSAEDFCGVVCDESSILKSYDGATKSAVTEFMKKLPYRLLATATAAPNDFIELGTSSEALGHLGFMDMLNRFFVNDQRNSALKGMGPDGRAVQWRLKGHAEQHFWRWVCSWARAVRKPSDIGGDDARFVLPALNEVVHEVKATRLADGHLFDLPARGLHEQREERRRTVQERCGMAADLINGTGNPAIAWCQLNDEGDLLESLIPDAVQVSGSDSDDEKEAKLMAFAKGEARVLVTKPVIGAWGLNFQHCAHMTMFPSHSFEQYYQSVRRCWRFGQKRGVTVDIVTTSGGQEVLRNLKSKQAKADEMFGNLVREMNNALRVERSNIGKMRVEVPSWMK